VGKSFANALELKQLATPANPPSGSVLLYFKSDGLLYRKDSSGSETAVGAGASSAPSNMVTTDTAQTVSGAKTLTARTRVTDIESSTVAGTYAINATFNGTNWLYINAGRAFLISHDSTTGDLLFRTAVSGTAGGTISWTTRATLGESGVVDNGNRAYSDSNAPQTIEMTEFPDASVGASPNGEAQLYTTDGTILRLRGDDGFTRTVGDNVNEYNATADYVSTNPQTPLFGVKMFSRHRGRRMLAFVGPMGQDTRTQPFLGGNRVVRANAINGLNTLSTDGVSITTISTGTAISNSTSSFYSAMTRIRYTTSTTAATGVGIRSSTAQWFLSSTANMGGFHMVCRFGLGAVTSGQRMFIGMSTTTGALSASSDPTALLSLVGFGINSGQTTLRFICNDSSGTATSVDLGSNFPTNTAATNFYEVGIFSASGVGANVQWSATRINDGVTVNGSATTDLPALSTLMSSHVHYTNGSTAAAGSIDVQSLYVESDN